MPTVRGSAKTVADTLKDWFTIGEAGGFMLMLPIQPTGLADFVGRAVPELQRRQLFRTEHRGRMLRDHFVLPAPVSFVKSI